MLPGPTSPPNPSWGSRPKARRPIRKGRRRVSLQRRESQRRPILATRVSGARRGRVAESVPGRQTGRAGQAAGKSGSLARSGIQRPEGFRHQVFTSNPSSRGAESDCLRWRFGEPLDLAAARTDQDPCRSIGPVQVQQGRECGIQLRIASPEQALSAVGTSYRPGREKELARSGFVSFSFWGHRRTLQWKASRMDSTSVDNPTVASPGDDK